MAKKSTRLEELHNTFQENGISPETVMQNDKMVLLCITVYKFNLIFLHKHLTLKAIFDKVNPTA